MVKQNPKEKLNNKAAKMIDLALDEVFTGGTKSITASFKDSRYADKLYTLTVEVAVNFLDDDGNIITPVDDTPVGDNTTTPDNTPVGDTTTTPDNTPVGDTTTPSDNNTIPPIDESVLGDDDDYGGL